MQCKDIDFGFGIFAPSSKLYIVFYYPYFLSYTFIICMTKTKNIWKFSCRIAYESFRSKLSIIINSTNFSFSFLFTMTIIGIFYHVLHLFSYFYFIGTKTLQVWLPAGKQKILKKIDSFIMFSLVMYDFSPSYVWKWISLPIAVHTYCIK